MCNPGDDAIGPSSPTSRSRRPRPRRAGAASRGSAPRRPSARHARSARREATLSTTSSRGRRRSGRATRRGEAEKGIAPHPPVTLRRVAAPRVAFGRTSEPALALSVLEERAWSHPRHSRRPLVISWKVPVLRSCSWARRSAPPSHPRTRKFASGTWALVWQKNRGIYSGVFVWLIQAGLRVVHFFKAHPISEMAF